MKPTSIIFLILAAVLLVSGIVLCLIGSSIASSNDIPLVNESIRGDDELTTDELDEYDITEFKINIKDVTVNIFGSAKKSKVEFVNINPAVYEYKIANGKMEINSIKPFEISSLIKISESGSGFSGLRSYLNLGRYEDKQAYINIYIAEKAETEAIKVTTSAGDINVLDMTDACEYDLNTKKGNVSLENINTEKRINVALDKGDLKCDLVIAKDLIANIKKGDAALYCDRKYSIIADTENGNIFFDEENMGSSVTLAYPNIEKTETVLNEDGTESEMVVSVDGVKLTVGKGNISIIDKTLNNEE